MSSNLPPNEQPQRQSQPLPRSSLDRAGALRAFIEKAVLTWRLFWDDRVGIGPKLIPCAAAIYLISPIDLLPAVLLGPLAPLGVVDDVGVVLLALSLFIQVSPPDVVKEHLRELGGVFMPHAADDDVIEGTARAIDQEKPDLER
jgi:uncharacterized membrane protein YkvA (DUF1232 family)